VFESRRNLALACTLSALAGYVDGIGFLHLGGLFVSFMSGNSTRLGVFLAEGHWLDAAQAIGLIALFVTGAAAGSLIVFTRSVYCKCWVLLAEGSLLVAAALSYTLGAPSLAIAAIVLAMGLENTVFQVEGGTGLGLTYMTGTLVKVGQLAAAALTGGRPLGLAAEPAAVGRPGRRRRVRRLGLSLDQSCRDLVCRRVGAGPERHRLRNGEAAGLTANAACPIWKS
jgi:uncharacterized membrane protein YoaK (UPF0700 family)